MAQKTKAQVLSILKTFVDMRENLRTYLAGDFETDYQACHTEIGTGDEEPETSSQAAALKDVASKAESLWSATGALIKTLHQTLGRYAGSDDLSQLNKNMSAFQQKLVDDSEAITSEAYSFSAVSAGGSNTGSGLMVTWKNDPNGTQVDVGHVETVTLKCTRDAIGTKSRTPEGAEEFTLVTEKPASRKWETDGGSTGEPYTFPYGNVSSEFNSNAPKIAPGGKLRSICSSYGNGVLNGGFESVVNGTSTSKIPDWTISSGEGNIDSETTSPIYGDASLSITGDCVFYQLIGTRVDTRVPLVFGYAVSDLLNSFSAGTATIVVKDDSTTHATASITLSSLTATPTFSQKTLILPDSVGDNLRIEVTVASTAGGGQLLLDEVTLQEMTQVDSGIFIALLSGLTPWRENDTMSYTVTATHAGKIQRAMNEVFGRYLEHAGTPVYWTDP